MDKKKLIQNMLLLAATTLLCLLLAEIGLRVWSWRIDEWYFFKRENARAEHVGRYGETAMEFSDNLKRVFGLRPRIIFKHAGVQVKTNGEGFRDRDYAVEKTPGTVRIVGIGDSFMFAQGVEQGEGYMEVMEDYLNKRVPERKWDVINLAIYDYNTVMEVETLKEFGLKYGPDLVVVGFIMNDFYAPWGARVRSDYFALDRSFLAEFIGYRLNPIVPEFTSSQERYAHLAGRASFDGAMSELKALSVKHGFEVLVFMFTDSPGKIETYAMNKARELGFDVFSADHDLSQYMKMSGFSAWKGTAMSIEDGHPSALSHSIAALAMVSHIKNSGILERLMKRR